MVAGRPENYVNIGRNPGLIVVHPVVHQHIAGDIDIGAILIPDAQGGCGVGQGSELPIVIGHRFAIRIGIFDAGVLHHIAPFGGVGG